MGFVRDTLGGITGSSAANASRQGSKLQYSATMEGIKLQQKALQDQQRLLRPFVNLAMPTRDGNPLSMLRNTAMQQEDYSYDPSSDPVLNNLLNRTQRSVLDSKAAAGKLGSGSTLTSLMEAMAPQVMARQQQMFDQKYNANNQQFNQLQNLVGMGQSAAAGQGAAMQGTANNVTNLAGQGANALAAGKIGAANAQAQGTNNMASLAALAYMAFSDERLKTDINRVGKMDDGTPIYTFKYKGDQKTHMGVMAQEARKKHPDAVRKDPVSNMLMVDYKRLGAK